MEPSLSPEMLPNIFNSLMVLVYSPLPLAYFLTLMPSDQLQLVLLWSAFGVIFSATIERIAPPTLALTAIYPCWDIPPPLIFNINAISVIIGDIMINSVPTESVVFVIPLDTSLMTIQLNIFLPLSHPRSLEDLSSFTSQGLVIEPGAQLYKEGNVTIFFPHRSTLLFTHSHHLLTWRGRCHSYINTSYLLIRTLSSFCFLDLSMDIANS